MDIENILKKAEFYLLVLMVVTLPLVVFSKFANVVDTAKLAYLVLILLVVILSKSIRSIMSNQISFKSSRFDIPVLLLVIAYIASAVLESPSRMDAFFLPGSATIVSVMGIIYFLATQLEKEQKEILKTSMFASITVYSLFTLLSFAGVYESIPQLPSFMRSPGFTTAGTPLSGVVISVSLLPIGIFGIIKEKEIANKALYGVSLGLIAFSVIVGVISMLPSGSTPLLLPDMRTSWEVAIESIKAKPLLGVGPGNYLAAFNQFKPLSYNATDLWNIRFSNGRSYLFTVMTETGVLGLSAFLFLLYPIIKLYKRNRKITSELASLGISTFLLLVLPSSILALFTFFLILAINSKSKSSEDAFSYNSRSARLPILIVNIPALLFVLAVGYYLVSFSVADFTYKGALAQISQGNGDRAYENLQKAIQRNPYVDRYRVSYAQVNLAIANSLASSEEELSEQTRNTIAQLIQQAIREGKAAVTLNPQKAANWEMLASIYRAVAPLAEGADGFAAQTYAQAIALDPYNPLTRISLGGIFYSAGQYDNAIDEFTLAARVKPDHANAYYNLAVAYKDNNQIDQAIAAMTQVLALVDNNSEDFDLASKTLEDLRERKSYANTSGSTDNLVAPEEIEPAETQIELPEDAEPPASEVQDEQQESDNSAPGDTAEPTPAL